GRATYEPGWRWLEHVGPQVNATRCVVEHLGLVVSGAATAAFDDGRIVTLNAGDLFYIPPVAHDSWGVGSDSYVSLHFSGTDKYAAPDHGKESNTDGDPLATSGADWRDPARRADDQPVCSDGAAVDRRLRPR